MAVGRNNGRRRDGKVVTMTVTVSVTVSVTVPVRSRVRVRRRGIHGDAILAVDRIGLLEGGLITHVRCDTHGGVERSGHRLLLLLLPTA